MNLEKVLMIFVIKAEESVSVHQ